MRVSHFICAAATWLQVTKSLREWENSSPNYARLFSKSERYLTLAITVMFIRPEKKCEWLELSLDSKAHLMTVVTWWLSEQQVVYIICDWLFIIIRKKYTASERRSKLNLIDAR